MDGLVGRMLADGVIMENRETVIALAIPKKAALRKPRGLHLDPVATKKNNGVGVYIVPKSDTYVYVKEVLADGSVMQLTRYKPIPRADREAMFAAGIAKGLKVVPLEKEKESKSDGPQKLVSIDDLK